MTQLPRGCMPYNGRGAYVKGVLGSSMRDVSNWIGPVGVLGKVYFPIRLSIPRHSSHPFSPFVYLRANPSPSERAFIPGNVVNRSA